VPYGALLSPVQLHPPSKSSTVTLTATSLLPSSNPLFIPPTFLPYSPKSDERRLKETSDSPERFKWLAYSLIKVSAATSRTPGILQAGEELEEAVRSFRAADTVSFCYAE